MPTNRGDGLRMAQSAGAALGNLSEAWWSPAMRVPGETIDGAAMFRVDAHRAGSARQHDRRLAGRRFADEAQNYNDFGRSLHEFDPAAMAFPRVPAWMIFDARYRSSYSVGPLRRRSPDADWLARGDDVGALAARIHVPADALQRLADTLQRAGARGSDEDFGRGDYAYDRYMGDRRARTRCSRRSRSRRSTRSRCSQDASAPRAGHERTPTAAYSAPVDESPIAGLYAAGNAAANPFGFAYPEPAGRSARHSCSEHRAGRAAAARLKFDSEGEDMLDGKVCLVTGSAEASGARPRSRWRAREPAA